MWYLCLLPLSLPRTTLTGENAGVGVVCLVAWILGQAVWLSQAYRLEFLGESVFGEMWAAGMLFLLANAGVLACFLVYARRDGVKAGAAGGGAGESIAARVGRRSRGREKKME